jgi:hypothetical protein
VQHVVPPPLAQPGQVGQLVDQTGGDQQPPRAHGAPVGKRDGEPVVVPGGRDDLAGDHGAAVPGDLGPAGGQQVARRGAVAAQVVVHLGGRGVPRRTAVHHQHRPARPAQGQRPAQPGGTAADHHHVVPLHRCTSRRPVDAPRVRHRVGD